MAKVKWKGRGVPFGFKFENGNLIPHPKHKKTVLLMYKLALTGNSLRDIALYLNSKKIPTAKGTTWNYKKVSYSFAPKRIMFNAGYDENWNEGNWEPIINKEIALKLLKLNTLPKHISSRPHKRKNLLTGIGVFKCGYCEATIKSTLTISGERLFKYYACTNKLQTGKAICSESRLIDMDKVDEFVVSELKKQYRRLDKIKKINESIKKTSTNRLKQQLERIDNEISKLFEEQRKTQNNKRIIELNDTIKELTEFRNSLIRKKAETIDFESLKKLHVNSFRRLKIENQKQIIKEFIKEIKLYSTHIVIEFNFYIDKKTNKVEIKL